MPMEKRVKFIMGFGTGLLIVGAVIVVVMIQGVVDSIETMVGIGWEYTAVTSGSVTVENIPDGESDGWVAHHTVYGEGIASDSNCEDLVMAWVSETDLDSQDGWVADCPASDFNPSVTKSNGISCDASRAQDFICEELFTCSHSGCGGEGIQYFGKFSGQPNTVYTFTSNKAIHVSQNSIAEMTEGIGAVGDTISGIQNALAGLALAGVGFIICLVGCCMHCCCKPKEAA